MCRGTEEAAEYVWQLLDVAGEAGLCREGPVYCGGRGREEEAFAASASRLPRTSGQTQGYAGPLELTLFETRLLCCSPCGALPQSSAGLCSQLSRASSISCLQTGSRLPCCPLTAKLTQPL